MIPTCQLALVANRVGTPLLLTGLVCFAVGILLMFHHRRQWLASLGQRAEPRVRLFEYRKFRRRAVLASMISSAGCIMAATYWLVDPKIWAVMMGALILLLIGIMGMAILDLMSVGLQQIAEPNKAAQKELVKKYLELREKSKPPPPPPEPPAA